MGKIRLSLIAITRNSGDLFEEMLVSAHGLADETVVVDSYSIDRTLSIARRFGARIFQTKEEDLGLKRALALRRSRGEWILSLDSDEQLSPELKTEIKKTIYTGSSYSGFIIPFKNHFLGRQVSYGGENYKMLRLFKKKYSAIDPALVHERFYVLGGRTGSLKNKIYHYSYRSLGQMYKKFTDYAICDAKQKIKYGAKTSLRKIILDPVHMFWARFVWDRGYKDGFFRIPLDLGFAYMEWLTYTSMLFLRKNRKNGVK